MTQKKDDARKLLSIIVATGLKIFGNKSWSNADYFVEAENFVAEAERRHGKLDDLLQ